MSKSTKKRAESEIDKMAPKQTRAMKAKVKELESAVILLVKRLRNIKNVKVQEGLWEKHWAENQRMGLPRQVKNDRGSREGKP